MADLSYFVVIDSYSGTFFGADSALLLDTRKLSEEELDDLNEGSDSDRQDLAEKHGIDLETLDLPTRPAWQPAPPP